MEHISLGWHVQRDRLLAEVHARPARPLVAPITAFRLANVSGQSGAEQDRAHMARLCRIAGTQVPTADARWWAVDTAAWSLRWERHTEFSTWTLFTGARGTLNVLPHDWLVEFPHDVLVATRLELRQAIVDDAPMPSDGIMVGAAVLDGSARVYTDMRPDAAGITHYRVALLTTDAAIAGRLALMLFEIETYRLMALLAFPVAARATAALGAIEAEAGELASRLADDNGVESDRALLSRLVALSGEAETLSAQTGFRFAGSSAYHDIVRDRIAALREVEIPGLQTIAAFMDRRLTPAMRTCDSVAAREQAVIARIGRAGAMLDTRIKVADEATNAELLRSMNSRADASLRLQRTVEGLSVAAISYYALMLLSYPVKAIEHTVTNFDATVALALLSPAVVMLVWIALHRVRRRIERD